MLISESPAMIPFWSTVARFVYIYFSNSLGGCNSDPDRSAQPATKKEDNPAPWNLSCTPYLGFIKISDDLADIDYSLMGDSIIDDDLTIGERV